MYVCHEVKCCSVGRQVSNFIIVIVMHLVLIVGRWARNIHHRFHWRDNNENRFNNIMIIIMGYWSNKLSNGICIPRVGVFFLSSNECRWTGQVFENIFKNFIHQNKNSYKKTWTQLVWIYVEYCRTHTHTYMYL